MYKLKKFLPVLLIVAMLLCAGPVYARVILFTSQPLEAEGIFNDQDGNAMDSVDQIVAYITKHGITPSNVPSSQSASSSSSSSSALTSRPDFMIVRDRMRVLAHHMSHRVLVPKVTKVARKVALYKIMQVQGNVSKLKFERARIQGKLDNAFPLLKPLWNKTGWVRDMKIRIQVIDGLLNQEVTMQLDRIRTGKLSDAEAVVAEIAARWPYRGDIIYTVQEYQKIQAYINKVGFNELQAVQDLIASRPDYQRKVAEQKAELVCQQELAKQQEAAQQRQKELEAQRQREAELASQEQAVQAAESAMRSVLPQGMQHEIIGVLGNNTTQKAVAQQLDTKVQEVIRQAELHNVIVHPELDWRLQAALKALPKSVNAKDFTFQLATIEHLVSDIHMQASPGQKSLMERSPELMAQAVSKFWEYLSPTEMELALIVDTARYVSDMTTGSEYLSPAVREQRVAQFWNVIDNISWSNLSQVTAEQVVDSVAYVAARATYVIGVRGALSVIKNVKNIAVVGPRASAVFAERVIKAFDSVISANPVLITNEGAVVWNASPEMAAEARQLVQAFNGLKDKPTGKPPAEILDDTQKVVENEAKLETKTVGDLVKESTPGRETKGKTTQYDIEGDSKKAYEYFESMKPKDIKDVSTPDVKQKVGTLDDGRRVIFREKSQGKMGETGPPTLEIQRIESKRKMKFRFKG